jgi:hypothetical protein
LAKTSFEELDEQVVKRLGFAPLSTVYNRWLSAEPLGPLVFGPPTPPSYAHDWQMFTRHPDSGARVPPPGFAYDWESFTQRSERLISHGVQGIQAIYSHPEAMSTLLLLSIALPNTLDVEWGPVAHLVGDSYLLFGKEAEPNRDTQILDNDILFNLLLLELDSYRPTEMWDWFDAVARDNQIPTPSLVNRFLGHFNLSFDDIDWDDRMRV